MTRPGARTWMPLLGLCALTAACANTAPMRDLAAQSRVQADAEGESLSNFVALQSQINAADYATRRDYDEMAAWQRRTTNLNLQTWKIGGDTARPDALAALTGAAAEDVMGAAPSEPPPADLDDGGAGAALSDASRQFGLLARKPSTLDQLKETYAAANTVYSAWDGVKAKAATEGAGQTAPPPPAVAAPDP